MLDKYQNETAGRYFSKIPPDADRLPFSDEEARLILNCQESLFSRHVKIGYIKRSIVVHYRLDLSFHFFGFYDLFEYALRHSFFFLNYGTGHQIINELICSLVDEMASVIDFCPCNTFVDCNPPLLENVMDSLVSVCRDNVEGWRQYWLKNGDTFSEEECAYLALRTWNKIFDRAMKVLDPNEECFAISGYSDGEFGPATF